jgi:hypothetical protein
MPMKNYWIKIAVDYDNACAPIMQASADFIAMLDEGVSSDIMLDVFDNALEWGKFERETCIPGLYKLTLDWVVDTDWIGDTEADFWVTGVELLVEFPK